MYLDSPAHLHGKTNKLCPVKLCNFTATHEIGTEETALPVLLCNP